MLSDETNEEPNSGIYRGLFTPEIAGRYVGEIRVVSRGNALPAECRPRVNNVGSGAINVGRMRRALRARGVRCACVSSATICQTVVWPYQSPRESNAIFTRSCPRSGLLSSHGNTSVITWTGTRVVIAEGSRRRVLNARSPPVLKLIGSIRRECLDHVMVLHKRHLLRLLTDYFHGDHHWRTHRALAMDCPVPRPVQRPELGLIREVPEGGGLHHHYERRAA